MKSKIQILVFSQIILCLSCLAQNSDTNPLEIIKKNIMVSGGRENLLKVHTIYSELGIEMDGRSVRWVTKEMYPNKGAFQILYQMRVVYEEFFDGAKGYQIIRGEKKLADSAEFKDKMFKKNLFNELDFLDSTLWKLNLISEDTTEGELCYRINAKLINGATRILWYSKKTFLLLRTDKVSELEKSSFPIAIYSDYKKIGAFIMWTHLKLVRKDGSFIEGIMMNWKINEGVSEDDFK